MRKRIAIAFAMSVLGAGAGYIFTNSGLYGICTLDGYQCRDVYNRIGDPVFFGMTALSIVFLALFFLPSAFNLWKKFATWSLPLMVVIFTLYKGPGGGFMDPTPYPKQVFLWLSILYVLISFMVIAYSHHKLKIKK